MPISQSQSEVKQKNPSQTCGAHQNVADEFQTPTHNYQIKMNTPLPNQNGFHVNLTRRLIGRIRETFFKYVRSFHLITCCYEKKGTTMDASLSLGHTAGSIINDNLNTCTFPV